VVGSGRDLKQFDEAISSIWFLWSTVTTMTSYPRGFTRCASWVRNDE
jgi:hypothetical protein